jgi:hypothetical protein
MKDVFQLTFKWREKGDKVNRENTWYTTEKNYARKGHSGAGEVAFLKKGGVEGRMSGQAYGEDDF